MTEETFLRFAPPLLAVLVSVPATMYLTDRNNERNENRKHSVALSDVDKQRRSEFMALVNRIIADLGSRDYKELELNAKAFNSILDGGEYNKSIGIDMDLANSHTDLRMLTVPAHDAIRTLESCERRSFERDDLKRECEQNAYSYLDRAFYALQYSLIDHGDSLH